jgi:predicted RNase H-like HicB family nuclease
MSETKTYVAVYQRDEHDDAWNVHIKGLPGCQTYGRSLRQAQGRIREALALWLDKDADSLTVRDQVPAAVRALADGVAKARRTADRADAEARQRTAQAVKQLTDLGLSRRDAAELLGLSHQRIQQLVEAG